MTAIWKIWSKLPSIYHPRAGGKQKPFWSNSELWPNISLQWNMISNLSIYRDSQIPYMPPNLVNFGPETAENVWQVFVPPKFLHSETLPA